LYLQLPQHFSSYALCSPASGRYSTCQCSCTLSTVAAMGSGAVAAPEQMTWNRNLAHTSRLPREVVQACHAIAQRTRCELPPPLFVSAPNTSTSFPLFLNAAPLLAVSKARPPNAAWITGAIYLSISHLNSVKPNARVCSRPHSVRMDQTDRAATWRKRDGSLQN
jgi:hypothetical protein